MISSNVLYIVDTLHGLMETTADEQKYGIACITNNNVFTTQESVAGYGTNRQDVTGYANSHHDATGDGNKIQTIPDKSNTNSTADSKNTADTNGDPKSQGRPSLSVGRVRVSPIVTEKTFVPDAPLPSNVNGIRHQMPSLSHIHAAVDRTAVKTKMFFIVTGLVLLAAGSGLVCAYPPTKLRDLLIMGSGCIVIGLMILLGALVLIVKDAYLKYRADVSLEEKFIVPTSESGTVNDYFAANVRAGASYLPSSTRLSTPDVSKTAPPRAGDLYAKRRNSTLSNTVRPVSATRKVRVDIEHATAR